MSTSVESANVFGSNSTHAYPASTRPPSGPTRRFIAGRLPLHGAARLSSAIKFPAHAETTMTVATALSLRGPRIRPPMCESCVVSENLHRIAPPGRRRRGAVGHGRGGSVVARRDGGLVDVNRSACRGGLDGQSQHEARALADRKSTRLNSSHVKISYAVFCLKKKIP